MVRATVWVASVPLAALLAGCGELAEPTGPTEDAAFLAPALSASASPASSSTRGQVLMLDACDPESFNAVLGPGFCAPANPNRRGGISLSTFVSLLEKHQRVDAWRFAPDVIHVTETVTLSIPNQGGIPHSFTEVEEFGGGFVPFLNVLSGNTVLAPECVHPGNPSVPHPDVQLIPPGAHGTHTFHPGEAKKYMCCIHPWMRAVSR